MQNGKTTISKAFNGEYKKIQQIIKQKHNKKQKLSYYKGCWKIDDQVYTMEEAGLQYNIKS